jgi:type IV secretion system protein TrbL
MPALLPALPSICVPLVGEGCPALDGIVKAFDFASDPLGYIAQQLQDAANGLATTVLPELEKVTHPDLTKDWFIGAYQISFALGFLLWIMILAHNFYSMARRRVSGGEVLESLTFYTPAFFIGAAFGPLAGQFLVRLAGALTESFMSWGITGSVGEATQNLSKAITAGDPAKVAGGAVVAIIVFCCMVLALLMVLLVLLVMLVTQYFTGALVPLGLAWIMKPRQREKGFKLIFVWLGILCSHTLLFFLLGLALHMSSGLVGGFTGSGLQILVNLVVAAIALIMVALSPAALLKFAPVGPTGTPDGGPGLSVPSRHSGGAGPVSASDSQTGQLSRSSASDSSSDLVDDDEPLGSSGGLVAKVDALRGSPDAGSQASGTAGVAAASGTPGSEEDTGDGATTGPVAGIGDGASALSHGSEKADQAGDKLEQAGAAGDATGAGATVGVPMQIAGAALKAGAAFGQTTAQLAQAGGEYAQDQMDHIDQEQR